MTLTQIFVKSLSIFCVVAAFTFSDGLKISDSLRTFLATLEKYENQENDIVYLLDESGSIRADRFPHVKLFAEITAQRFAVSYDFSRIDVVTFSDKVRNHTDYVNSRKGNMCMLLKEIRNIDYGQGGTYTHEAMVVARDILSKVKRNSNKIIIILTDGESNPGHSPVAISQTLKAEGVIIFAVGVADVNTEEVYAIASSPNHVYILKNFNDIADINKELVNDTHEVSMDMVDPSLCGGLGVCDDHANCYCGTRTGKHECACIAGYYGKGVKGECQKCPKGTYKDKALNTNCILCPDYSTTVKEGSTNAKDCICHKGYEKIGNDCKALRCATLTAPEGGILIPSNCNNTYGTKCSFKCRAGYCPFSCKDNSYLPQPIGQHVDLPTRTCLETRNWTGEEFYCEKVACPSLQFPAGGKHNCSEKDFTFGTSCKFDCDKGYELYGSDRRSCLLNGSWTGQETQCHEIHCKPLKLNLNLKVRPAECGLKKMPYRTVCQYYCTKGYALQSENNDTAGVFRCESTKKWSGADTKISCQDIVPPKIVCPPSIVVNAELHKSYALVTWKPPFTSDNLNFSKPVVDIIKPKGLKKPPYRFKIGTEKVVYRATDTSNLSSECSFEVKVLDKEPPKVTFCPPDIEVYHDNGTAIPVTWEEPVFEDNSKEKLDINSNRRSGNDFGWGLPYRVNYNATDKSGNTATCSFLVKVKHYACPYYPPPANGLLTCDTWIDGRVCSIYCHEGFQFATGRNTPTNFLCRQIKDKDKVEGMWLSTSRRGSKVQMPWPDCSKMLKPKSVKVTMDTSFSVDSCSEEVLQKIRTRFIKDFKKLPPSLCPATCIPENVNITCHSPRIKRSIRDSGKDELSTSQLTITFNIETFSNVTGQKTSSDGVEEPVIEVSSNSVIKDLESKISENVKDAYEMTEVPTSVTHFDVVAICSTGQLRVNDSCVNCPAGSYKEDVSDTCSMCPHATYQDEESQLSCKPCPEGYATYDINSKSKEDCKGPCQPGTHSETTFEPCLACPFNSYQERASRKDCLQCPPGLYTWKVGSNSSKDCVARCKPGSYSGTGFEPCSLCDVYSYQEEEQQLSCKRCPNRTRTTIEGSTNAQDCKEIDLCNDLSPCPSGSTCVQLDVDYKCLCPAGLFGRHCEINIDDCDPSPCLNNGTCKDGIGTFTCWCRNGFTGRQCEINIDDCKSNPCRNGECVDLIKSYSCICKPGYIGDNCEINVDECESNPCLNNGTCFDKENDYRCCCSSGFYGRNCEREINVTTSLCDTVKCENGGNCSLKDDGFTCVCPPGFEGEFCELNIDDCIGYECQNGGICIDGVENAICSCPLKFAGQYCEEALPPEFFLSFPEPPSTLNYVQLPNNRILYAITVAFFMRTNFKDPNSRATPVSYSYENPHGLVDNALTLLDTNSFVLFLHGKVFHTRYVANKDSYWHHYAVTWDKNGGKWAFYVDGKPVESGSQVGEDAYMHPGLFILGQEQDKLGDSFSTFEAFAGDITEFNVWDYAFTSEEINQIASSCGYVGNVIPWHVAAKALRGNVGLSLQVDKCKDIGICQQEECNCFYSNRTEARNCKYDVKECTPLVCSHDQDCVTGEDHSFCNCSTRFDGRTCEYDIDECLENNGGCEYICNNTVGSYHCDCPHDMFLSEDQKSCKETSFCMENGEVRPDGETWVSSCQDCICDHGVVRCEEKTCNESICSSEETLITLPGECCSTCVAWSYCVISPNNTIHTFDLSSYKVEGECIYTAVEDCIGGRFKLDVEPVQNGRGEMNVIIYQDCTKVVMSFDGSIFVDDVAVELPFRNEEISVEEDEVLSSLVVRTHSNLFITWNFTEELVVGVPFTDESKVCGLCKNIQKYYAYDVQKYPLPQRFATGEKCHAIFEGKAASHASSIVVKPGFLTTVLCVFTQCLPLYAFHILTSNRLSVFAS